jgi:hypothetical protein
MSNHTLQEGRDLTPKPPLSGAPVRVLIPAAASYPFQYITVTLQFDVHVLGMQSKKR